MIGILIILFFMVMAIMFAMNLTKTNFGVTSLNERIEIFPGVYNTKNSGLSACAHNVTTPVLSEVFTLTIPRLY